MMTLTTSDAMTKREADDFAFKLYERGYIYIAERPQCYVKTILEAQGVTYELQYHPRRPAALCGGYTFYTYIAISECGAKGRKLLLSREPYDPDAAENLVRDIASLKQLTM